jgi:hypothetical protein
MTPDRTSRFGPTPGRASYRRRGWSGFPVSSEQNRDPGDVLFLDRVAERTSDGTWRLDRDKIITAVEDGLEIDAIAEFLDSHSPEAIPQTVRQLFTDLRASSGRLRDRGTVRMIECADAETARLILLDPKLKTLCVLAGERNLIFRVSDERAVRTHLRKTGHILPPVR